MSPSPSGGSSSNLVANLAAEAASPAAADRQDFRKAGEIETRGRPLLNAPDGAAAISSGRKPRDTSAVAS